MASITLDKKETVGGVIVDAGTYEGVAAYHNSGVLFTPKGELGWVYFTELPDDGRTIMTQKSFYAHRQARIRVYRDGKLTEWRA